MPDNTLETFKISLKYMFGIFEIVINSLIRNSEIKALHRRENK